jgi:tetratricopeptide (TPR) repeat protein
MREHALLEAGLAHHRAARLAEAERCYRALLAVAPAHADGLHLLGLVLHAGADHASSVAHLQQAVRLRPDATLFLANLGIAHLAAAQLAEAERCFRGVLEREPTNADFWHNLGLTLLRQQRAAEAVPALRTAVALAPGQADAHAQLGAGLHAIGRDAEAAVELRAALALQPSLTPARACLGLALAALGSTEAEACFREVLREYPDDAAALTNLGNFLREHNRFAEAEFLLRRVVLLRPEQADAHHNLAVVLAAAGTLADAEVSARAALRLDPDHADAQYSLGTTLLSAGRLPEGFAGFEWRWRRRGFAPPRSFEQPRWDGGPLAGRTLLLHAEQGLGDVVQMLRFVPAIAAGGRVVLEVPAPLRRLAAQLPVPVLAAGEALPGFDVQCPLPSLPFALRLTLVPGAPYLRAMPGDGEKWADRVAALPGARVGLCWAGNPHYQADHRRSIPPELLSVLAHPEVSFVSLQPGAAPPPGLALHDWTAELSDFADTAALIECLDLVVSVDTAVAHLAGALGKPVWLLDRFDSCWRWLRNRSDSPWYPTLRIIRQERPGDWRSVLATARASLAADRHRLNAYSQQS